MKKKKIRLDEFSKVIVLVIVINGVMWVNLSYLLSFLGYDSNSEVTVAVVSFLLSVVINGYFLKSYGEKNSRNHYNVKIDEDENKGSDSNGTE